LLWYQSGVYANCVVYNYSLEVLSKDEVTDCVYQVARDRMTTAAKAVSSFPFTEYQKTIMADLEHADKENGIVYHVRVPEASTLGAIDKAVVAKSVTVSSPMSSNFTGESVGVMRCLILPLPSFSPNLVGQRSKI